MKASFPESIVPDGFDALFVAHYTAVYRLAYRIAGTREEAEDLAQETFLRLHRHAEVWQGKRDDDPTVRPWLYRVVTNLAYNTIRAQARRQRRETWAAAGDKTGEALDLAGRAGVQETVRQSLAMLEERQVQLLLLRQEGLSYRELAAVLRVAPGSIGTLLARAEAAFERAYRKLGGGE
jgi:RNA polymerase sigma-70 factor, ECF subfamily